MEAGLPARNFQDLENVLCNVLEYYQIHEIVDAAVSSGLAGGDWLHKEIGGAGGTISWGKAQSLFLSMEAKVMELRGA
jgi:hypothetical protein